MPAIKASATKVPVAAVKPGYQTTEFWLVIAANILTNVGAIDVSDKYKGIVLAASALGYALSRGLAKQPS